MRTIAITGSEGFIGTHLKTALRAFYEPQPADQPKVRVECIDLKAGGDILDHRIEPDTEVIFHLAAQTSVQKSIEDPAYDAMTNIAGTIQVLRENPKAKIIITASGAGKDPKSPYGISKMAQEHYAQVIHSNAVVLRLPNVFAEDDHGVVGAFLRGDKCVVNGDGLQTRDFVHVEDVCNALLRAVDWAPGVYELSGRNVTVLELAQATGKPIEHAPELPGEIRETHMENTTPDWKPVVDVLEFIRAKSI